MPPTNGTTSRTTTVGTMRCNNPTAPPPPPPQEHFIKRRVCQIPECPPDEFEEEDTIAPLFVQGVGVKPNNFPSVTNFPAIRPLNVPAYYLFPCICGDLDATNNPRVHPKCMHLHNYNNCCGTTSPYNKGGIGSWTKLSTPPTPMIRNKITEANLNSRKDKMDLVMEKYQRPPGMKVPSSRSRIKSGSQQGLTGPSPTTNGGDMNDVLQSLSNLKSHVAFRNDDKQDMDNSNPDVQGSLISVQGSERGSVSVAGSSVPMISSSMVTHVGSAQPSFGSIKSEGDSNSNKSKGSIVRQESIGVSASVGQSDKAVSTSGSKKRKKSHRDQGEEEGDEDLEEIDLSSAYSSRHSSRSSKAKGRKSLAVGGDGEEEGPGSRQGSGSATKKTSKTKRSSVSSSRASGKVGFDDQEPEVNKKSKLPATTTTGKKASLAKTKGLLVRSLEPKQKSKKPSKSGSRLGAILEDGEENFEEPLAPSASETQLLKLLESQLSPQELQELAEEEKVFLEKLEEAEEELDESSGDISTPRRRRSTDDKDQVELRKNRRLQLKLIEMREELLEEIENLIDLALTLVEEDKVTEVEDINVDKSDKNMVVKSVRSRRTSPEEDKIVKEQKVWWTKEEREAWKKSQEQRESGSYSVDQGVKVKEDEDTKKKVKAQKEEDDFLAKMMKEDKERWQKKKVELKNEEKVEGQAEKDDKMMAQIMKEIEADKGLIDTMGPSETREFKVGDDDLPSVRGSSVSTSSIRSVRFSNQSIRSRASTVSSLHLADRISIQETSEAKAIQEAVEQTLRKVSPELKSLAELEQEKKAKAKKVESSPGTSFSLSTMDSARSSRQSIKTKNPTKVPKK